MLPLRPLQFGGVVLVALSTLFLLSTWWSSSSTSQPQHHSLTSPDLQAPEILAPGTPRPTAHTGRRRVAVIGAGASGSAAAFFLDRAAKEANAHVDVVVYEKNDYIGGRSTTIYPYGDLTLTPVELGASVFVDANLNLMRAVERFNLSLVPWAPPPSDDGDDGLTIWDGTSFLFTSKSAMGWWDKAKLLWRYGYTSPTRTQTAVKELLHKFGDLYDSKWVRKHGAFEHIEKLSEEVGFDDFAAETTMEWFTEEVKASERWTEEMVEAATRVNYAQDTTSVHALIGMVSLAATGASSVVGGNWRIFQSFLKASKAKVHLNTEVTSISPILDINHGSTSWQIHTNASDHGGPSEDQFDALFFANPWHQSKVSEDETLEGLFGLMDAIPPQPYIHLHVTFVTTTSSRPLPSFFNLPDSTVIPRTILTSAATYRHTPSSPLPEFQSITYHGQLFPGSEEWVVKIFSLERRSDAWLESLFGKGQVGWIQRKEWDSYPKLPPTKTYPPIMPLGNTTSFYYLAALEPWISTMETQTLSARNAVGLLAKAWWGLEMGVCGPDARVQGRPGEEGEGGWDWTC